MILCVTIYFMQDTKMRCLPLTALLLSMIAGGAAQAGVLDLTTQIGNANIYTLHNFSGSNSDVEGAVVSGGSVTASSYAINHNNVDAYGGYAVVARNNLTMANGSIENGKAYVGGTTSLTSVTAPPTSATSPVNFDQLAAYYNSLSSNLSHVGATGTVSSKYSGVLVTGNGNGKVDVFNVASSMFATSSSWELAGLTAGQTLIFNVSGTNGTFNNGGISFNPLSGYNVLFNFYEATTLDVRGVIGSVLATKATVGPNYGVINGNVVVDTWSSSVQVNANHFFQPVEVTGFEDPGVPTSPTGGADVPEPASAALVLAALGMIGFVRRKRAPK